MGFIPFVEASKDIIHAVFKTVNFLMWQANPDDIAH
jgi:hypothetical protein